MHRRLPVALASALLATVLSALGGGTTRPARAVWIESLLMPGDLAAKHAHLERQCTKCHRPFDKAAQDRLCLACHRDVADDLSGARGFHGRAPSVRGERCKRCHTEHEGRAANIVPLDRHTFDHRLTDMPLRGGHVGAPCDGCHAAGTRFRDAPSYCAGCHTGTDPHEQTLGTACGSCHEESAWSAVRFDHANTAFPLVGRHRGLACEACHVSRRFRPSPTACHSCHEHDDKHHGGLGSGCQSCHTPRAWSAVHFDHARRTSFALLGRHTAAPCEKCHQAGTVPERTSSRCYSCHERNDAHRRRFGQACETCHTPVEWARSTFAHERSTSFPLRGRHAQVRCPQCHQGDLYSERLDASCVACHRDDDIHHGREGTRCAACHDERGWHREVLFDHDTTRFPLKDAHARVPCTECHLSPTFAKVERECVACHQKDDVHHGRLGPRCDRCHGESTFFLPADASH